MTPSHSVTIYSCTGWADCVSVHRMAGLLFTWQLKKAKLMWWDGWLRPGLSLTYSQRYINGHIMYLLFTSNYTVEPLIMDPPRSGQTLCERKYSFLTRSHYLCHTDWCYSTLHCQSAGPHWCGGHSHQGRSQYQPGPHGMETALHNAVYSVYTVHDAVTDVMLECTYSHCMMSCLLLCTGWKYTHHHCQIQRPLWHCPSAGERKQVELDNYSRRMWKL